MNATQIICLIFIILISMVIGRRTKRLHYPIVGEINLDDMKFKFYFSDIKQMEKTLSNSPYMVLRVKSRQNHVS